jgi:hypothetical protein
MKRAERHFSSSGIYLRRSDDQSCPNYKAQKMNETLCGRLEGKVDDVSRVYFTEAQS